LATNRTELDQILDAASARLDTAVEDEFEKAIAQQGLDLIDLNAEDLLSIGRKAFGHALILIAAGSPAEARASVGALQDFDERILARKKALKVSHDEGELQEDVFDFLGGAALMALKAALPFVLAVL